MNKNEQNERFAEALALLLEKAGKFTMLARAGEFWIDGPKVEITRIHQMENYIGIDLDNGQRFNIVVENLS